MENEADKKRRSVRRTIILMSIIALLPIFAALLLYQNTQWIDQYKNYGTLIIPPVQWEDDDLIPVGDFAQQHFAELDGRWVLMHLFVNDNAQCNEQCKKDIINSRQLWMMLNKDLMRVRRVLAFTSVTAANTFLANIEQEKKPNDDKGDPFVLYAIASNRFRTAIQQVIPNPQHGMMLLRDPLGNVMLWYGSSFDPYKVKKDLSRLFRTSRVG
jgi:hypothetical protein